ncbi:MAG: RDD family protein, partial [Chloroflexi bacterium]
MTDLGKFISAIILCIGYLMIAFTEKKQGLHDIMADCLV